ncbi:MAG TPA: alpha/beta hydrolase-fold protein [Stellaceae bacterium]|nr:alpha/beta hydrolase-fold protein [Stellaceae bacterium]
MGAATATAAEHGVSIAGLAVTVWTPDAASTGPLPMVIFSHGFHGCATQSRFLTEALAAAGYIVFAPNHRDATCNGGNGHWFNRAEVAFGQPEQWTQATYRDRGDDLARLIAALRNDAQFARRIDWQRVALAGHSLGGYTVLGAGGAWPTWRLPGLKAVLALSPYAEPFIVRHTLSGLAEPVMYQGGTADFGITPYIEKNAGAYDLSPRPKYFVDFKGAGHFAWADIGRNDMHPPIVAYSLAFLDHYVRGAVPSTILTHVSSGVARLRYDSELGSSDR